jgi:hypothetical protein
MKSIILTLLCLPIMVVSQVRSLPSPLRGWDSLSAQIQYPELLVLAGARLALVAELEIDSAGIMRHLLIQPFSGRYSINNVEYYCPFSSSDSMFIDAVVQAFKSVLWRPGTFGGRVQGMKFELPIIFTFYPASVAEHDRRTIIIDAVRSRQDY